MNEECADVALPLLSLFIDIKSAAMLLSMPLIFSNLPQALEGGSTAASARSRPRGCRA